MMNEEERRKELAQFLRTRREHLAPQQAGIPLSARRRTPGLRREELAGLAGVGATWYTWLEQGRAISVSAQVLESLARVLQLDADERAHLFILARQQIPADPLPLTRTIDPALQLILDTMGIYPAWILNPRWDVVAWNQAMCHAFGDISQLLSPKRHLLWLLFADSYYLALFPDWEASAQRALAFFRASTQRYVGESWLTQLIQELSQTSPAFREWWPRHDIQGKQTEQKRLIHPQVGLLVLQPRTFQVRDYPDLQMIVCTPVPDTDTMMKLELLSQSPHASVT